MTRTHDMAPPHNLLTQLRKMMPKRALSYNESITVGRFQAARVRALLDISDFAMPFDWVAGLPGLELEVVPAHQLGEHTSGLTTRRNGRYLIQVNKNRSVTHRRFTLAHELKHVLDYPYARTLHAGLGTRDADRQIERISDDFAAHLLMPSLLVKRAWAQEIRQPRALARAFQVSEQAMGIRLDNLGLIGDEDRPAVTYFRGAQIPA